MEIAIKIVTKAVTTITITAKNNRTNKESAQRSKIEHFFFDFSKNNVI